MRSLLGEPVPASRQAARAQKDLHVLAHLRLPVPPSDGREAE
jgi:hypothetical protein